MKSSLFGWGTVQSCLFRCNNAEISLRMDGTVLLVFFDLTMQRSLLGWRTVQSCLFRYNNAEFYVGMVTDSVLSLLMHQCRVCCWDGERFNLVFFDVTMKSSLFGLGTAQHDFFLCV